jgi:hypothetical protein
VLFELSNLALSAHTQFVLPDFQATKWVHRPLNMSLSRGEVRAILIIATTNIAALRMTNVMDGKKRRPIDQPSSSAGFTLPGFDYITIRRYNSK